MPDFSQVARPYAKAVFAIAQKEQDFESWSRALEVLSYVVKEAKVKQFIKDPSYSASAIEQALVKLCGDHLSSGPQKLLRILIQRKRLFALPSILDAFEAYRAEAQNTTQVHLETAYPLTSVQTKKLEESLRARFKNKIALESTVCPDLIGGAVLKIGDRVIDYSAKGLLDRLAAVVYP